MPYVPIPLELNLTPEAIRSFVGDRVEPYLRDVRLMLEYPKVPGEPGFNLTAASVLFAVMGGLSRVFYNNIAGDRASFKESAKRYAVHDEPAGAIRDPDVFAERLYTIYRCNLAHSLGLNMERDQSDRWTIRPLSARVKVTRWPALPLSEEMLQALDGPAAWPGGLPATLSEDAGVWRLSVDSLYCGVRRLARTLSEDQSLQSVAVTVLKPWFEALQTPAGWAGAVVSSATPVTVSYSTGHAVDETLGAKSEIRAMWAKPADDE